MSRTQVTIHAMTDVSQADLNLLLEERTAEITELYRFYEAIVDSSTETFIIAVSGSGYVLSFNEGARQLFGYTGQDIVGRMRASDLISEREDRQARWSAMEERAKHEGKSRDVVPLQRSDGSVFPALVDLTLLLNSEHQALGTLFVGRDMTDAFETQRALEERTAQLEFLNTLSLEIGQTLEVEQIARLALKRLVERFDATEGAFFLRNAETQELGALISEPKIARLSRMALLTPTVEDTMLIEDGEVLIREVTLLHPEEHGPSHRLLLPLLPKASFLGVFVLLLRRQPQRDDELLNFLSTIATSIGGAMENAILYEESLAKSVEIRKQNKELDEFAYVVSHDLKEPLAGIYFISNLITDEYFDKMDDTGKTYISSLIDFSKRLGSLIDALLDLSRIGRINQPAEPVDISEVMHDVRQNLSYRMSSRDIRLVVQPDIPLVFGDKTRIEQVFFNLIGNAFKFNDKPMVRVDVTAIPADNDKIHFMVRDNGIGIEPVYFDKIFKIFERLNPREEYEGTGAGLTIVKKIIEHHGGEIWLESELDVGTTFHFTLPKVNDLSNQ